MKNRFILGMLNSYPWHALLPLLPTTTPPTSGLTSPRHHNLNDVISLTSSSSFPANDCLPAEVKDSVATPAAEGEAGHVAPVVLAGLADLDHLLRHVVDVLGTHPVSVHAANLAQRHGCHVGHELGQQAEEEEESQTQPCPPHHPTNSLKQTRQQGVREEERKSMRPSVAIKQTGMDVHYKAANMLPCQNSSWLGIWPLHVCGVLLGWTLYIFMIWTGINKLLKEFNQVYTEGVYGIRYDYERLINEWSLVNDAQVYFLCHKSSGILRHITYN